MIHRIRMMKVMKMIVLSSWKTQEDLQCLSNTDTDNTL